jgi:hypothetical protein
LNKRRINIQAELRKGNIVTIIEDSDHDNSIPGEHGNIELETRGNTVY